MRALCSVRDGLRDLEYTDVDFLVPERAYVDVDPVNMESLTPASAKNYGQEALGYLWKYIYNGKPYMFMFGYGEPFDSDRVKSAQHALTVGGVDVNFTASAGALALGDLLNLVELHFHDGANAVEAFPNEEGLVELHITYTINGGAAQILQTPFGAVEIPQGADLHNHVGRLRLSKHSSGSMDLSDSLADTPDGYNTDPFVMTHYELTGEIVPEAVLKRLFTFDEDIQNGAEAFTAPTLKAVNAEVREINLAHQAAQQPTRAPQITVKLLHLHRQCVQAAHAMVLRCGLVSLQL